MILIALGANLPSHVGAPPATLRAAINALAQRNVAVEALSPLYQSVAWPDPHDPEFVNAVARIETDFPPYRLLAVLKDVERMFGRRSGARNAPRPLDLDILDFRGRVESGTPTLPHPRMGERGFVLIPLHDVAPSWRHPVSGLAIEMLIESLPAEARALRRLDGPECPR